MSWSQFLYNSFQLLIIKAFLIHIFILCIGIESNPWMSLLFAAFVQAVIFLFVSVKMMIEFNFFKGLWKEVFSKKKKEIYILREIEKNSRDNLLS